MLVRRYSQKLHHLFFSRNQNFLLKFLLSFPLVYTFLRLIDLTYCLPYLKLENNRIFIQTLTIRKGFSHLQNPVFLLLSRIYSFVMHVCRKMSLCLHDCFGLWATLRSFTPLTLLYKTLSALNFSQRMCIILPR